MMRKNPVVCFEVDRVHDIGNWRSVVATGRFEELNGRDAIAAMDILIKRFVGMERSGEPHPSYVFRKSEAYVFRKAEVELIEADGREVVIFRIRLSEKTGRFEQTLLP
jgi:hypothetical protein